MHCRNHIDKLSNTNGETTFLLHVQEHFWNIFVSYEDLVKYGRLEFCICNSSYMSAKRFAYACEQYNSYMLAKGFAYACEQ